MAFNCFIVINFINSKQHYLHSIVFIILCLPQLIISYKDPYEEFSRHEDVIPLLEFKNTFFINSLENKNLDKSSLIIKLNAYNKSFTIVLQKNTQLLPSNYFEKHHHNGSYVTNFPHLKNQHDCYFKGYLLNEIESSWAAISTCNDSISGVFTDGIDMYYIHPKQNDKSVTLFRDNDLKSTFKCGFKNDTKLEEQLNHKRVKRSIFDPYASNSFSRYVELVIVNDFKIYEENKKDRNAVFERSKRIANIVNALYNQLNIYVTLVGVVVWTEKNEITLSSDGDQTLTNFLHYRRERLMSEHPNDNAQLITGSSFDGGVVGKALKGSICTFEYSGGVNTDHSHVLGLVATTVAHELGHNFGMEHDSDKCKCSQDKCIMAPSSSAVSPKYWSSCSHEYLEHSFKHGMDHCLKNKPKQLMGPVCGNGFLEDGEQCDCGLKHVCDNKCCNATSCKLMTGANCATGVCCDLTECNVISKDTRKVCRASRGECDLPEHCDGNNEFCPEDLTVQDGTSCNEDLAYCFYGSCNSHESQCELLWGKSGKVSDYKCYQQNTKGNPNGNCGYFRNNQTYKSCFISDVICGRLHCFYQNERLEYGTESAAILSRSFINIKGKVFTCRSAMIDLGLDQTDPGLVPNGAKCGTNDMCIDQKCVPVNSYLKRNGCSQNCNNNGLCDNRAVCHCFAGYNEPYCEPSLPGGYFFTIAMYIIFLCILPLTGITAFIIYNYHDKIKTWWLMQARKSAIKTRAKQISHRRPPRPPINFNAESLEISSPIPLENHENNISASSTITRNSFKSLSRPNLRNSDISAPIKIENSCDRNSVRLKPIRPAPPPPQPQPTSQALASLPPQQQPLTRSTSMRSSSRSTGRTRPTQPPPRPPRPKSSFSNVTSKQLNISDDNSKTFVPLSNQVTQTSASNTNQNVFKNSDKMCATNHKSVASLAKRFENS